MSMEAYSTVGLSIMLDDDTIDGHKAHYRRLEDPRLSAEEMDERRKVNIAYEYLCHLEEAKVWIEACINEAISPTVELEEGLRNGVALAKLAHFISPEIVPVKKIFDPDLSRFKARGLQFRHTDNINYWLRSLEYINLPQIFYPETTDIYDRKNMPRAIYCIHALSLYLFKLGRAPQIQDLYGKINFTDEQINNMRKELEKYGIQMPAFSKIGGILANEMPVDEAALHAAVIAINEAIERQQPHITLTCLLNPEAHLFSIDDRLQDDYQDILFDAKHVKSESVRNKSMDSGYIPDAYDELLTQAEIQGNVNKINTTYALVMLGDAIDRKDRSGLMIALRSKLLQLRDLNDASADLYMTALQKKKRDMSDHGDELLTKEEVQAVIFSANQILNEDVQKCNAVREVNKVLTGNNSGATLAALESRWLNLTATLLPAAQALYHEELKNMRAEKQDDLDYDEISSSLPVLTAIAKISEAIDTGNPQRTFLSLCDKDAHITGLDDSCKDKYHQRLKERKTTKCSVVPHSGYGEAAICSDFLTYFEIQESIDGINDNVLSEHERVEAVTRINEAIDRNDAEKTLQIMRHPSTGLRNVNPDHSVHYQNLLARVKQEKALEMHDPTAVLWYEEIQSSIDLANAHAVEANKLSVCVAAVNIAVEQGDERNLARCLLEIGSRLQGVVQQYTAEYVRQMQKARSKKEQNGETGSGWMMNKVRDGFKYYFNVNTMEHSWQRTDRIKKDHFLLTLDEIQNCVRDVATAHNRESMFKNSERFVVLLQSLVRGYLARNKFHARKTFLSTLVPAVIRVQSWWRMILVRRRYLERLHHLANYREAAIVLQAHARMYIAKKAYRNTLRYYKNHVAAVVKIQAFVRSAWARQDYKALVYGVNPPISVVRKFVHLLDIGDRDYTEEIELEKLRQQVVMEIRANQQLDSDLNQMDIKIGLLVKNRITLQDVISQNKMLKKYENGSSAENASTGLKALSKRSRERLEAYQHLFYLLQTNPVYLAKLIFEMPASRSTKFLESAILTLYNYASNQREEYLLLKLFKTALEEEISSKISTMADIIIGNPIVVKIIVSFNRNARGGGSLRDLLNPLVRSIVEDRTLQMNTNPVEVYKHWVNQTEAETGRALGLPYDVNLERALEHAPVRDRIAAAVASLQEVTERFLSAILQSIDKIPYGMRYMAKVMRSSLHARFPAAHEKDILKMVGNLIYYRYINSAIVAPDAFDIIDVGAVKGGLTTDQRRNLGSVAKILQFAASNKGFGADSPHLVGINKYIMDAHARFKKYFAAICDVEEPEVRFNMNQYSDAARVTKPVIYISVGEIIEIHKLLVENQNAVAPDSADPLHELLDDLGDVLEVDVLMGDTAQNGTDDGGLGSINGGTAKAQLAKTEISLTLSNKFELSENDINRPDKANLMLRTKRMIVDVIRCQRIGDSLVHVLSIPARQDEESIHQALIKERERVDRKANGKQAKLIRQLSVIGDTKLPLDTMKSKILANLQQLEQLGVVSRRDGYQFIINSIVQDIRNQRVYRQHRKLEMVRLRTALSALADKRCFFEEQINYYNQYVKTCLDNQAAKGRKSSHKGAPKQSVKYSALRLQEKGVVLEIEGLPHNQFKNVLFEISSTDVPGVFDVNAKFMGVNMEKVQLLFQDLLELQYEGVAVMKMFDRAQINVNLLVFLLNKKFFSHR